MLVVVQFPFADLRRFMSDSVARSRPPHWPPRQSTPPEFLHGFGRAVTRNRGVDQAWVDERVYCRANRALRFTRLARSGPGAQHLHCAFRRLLSDGVVVSRLEVGLGWIPVEEQTALWSTWDATLVNEHEDPTRMLVDMKWDMNPIDIVNRVVCLPTFVHPMAGDKRIRPLIFQGEALSRLFVEATTRRKEAKTPGSVCTGAPLVLIECRSHWLEQMPRGFVEAQSTGPHRLAYGRLDGPWGSVGVWLLGIEKSTVAETRSLRLCLLRLHAEQEALDLVLGSLSNGNIKYCASEEVGRRLDGYLNNSTRVVFRKKWAGVNQSAILEAFDAVASTERSSQRQDLADKLAGARRQVLQKLKAFEMRNYIRGERVVVVTDHSSYVENQEVNVGTTTVTISGGVSNSIVNIGSHLSEVTQKIGKMIQGNEGDRKELQDLTDRLKQQLEEVAKKKPEAAEAIAKQAKVLVNEVAEDKPNKTSVSISSEGLISAAKTVADIAPVVLETAGSIAKWVARVLVL